MQVLRTDDSRFADLPDFPFTPHYSEVASVPGQTLRMHTSTIPGPLPDISSHVVKPKSIRRKATYRRCALVAFAAMIEHRKEGRLRLQMSVAANAQQTSKLANSERPAALYVIKGGSFLCAVNFCMRYRPAARQPGDGSSGASHIGFRTVLVP